MKLDVPKTPLRLGFLLFPGFPMACLTSAIEPLRAANEISGERTFSWTLIGETNAPVSASAEVRFTPDCVLDEGLELDHLYLISPPDAVFQKPQRSPAVLRRMERAGMVLGAFSGGVFPLTRAGLASGHRCSVHWCYDAAFRAEFPDITAEQRVIVRDRRLVTASGADAVFELMLRYVEERLGHAHMTEVACWFQHATIRDEGAAQKVPLPRTPETVDTVSPAIKRAIRLFETHLEDPVRIPDAALAVGLSTRSFERAFKRETGHSPLRYYHLLRLSKARQKVLYSRAPLNQIALSLGYDTPGTMTRLYTEVFGVTPSEERRTSRAANRSLSPDWITEHE